MDGFEEGAPSQGRWGVISRTWKGGQLEASRDTEASALKPQEMEFCHLK